MVHDGALDLETVGVDGMIYRHGKEFVLEFFH
jgi:hypothetical protein